MNFYNTQNSKESDKRENGIPREKEGKFDVNWRFRFLSVEQKQDL